MPVLGREGAVSLRVSAGQPGGDLAPRPAAELPEAETSSPLQVDTEMQRAQAKEQGVGLSSAGSATSLWKDHCLTHVGFF